MNRDEFLKKQFEYAKARETAHFDKVISDDMEYKRRLGKLYKETADEIEKTMESMFTRFALSEGIPIEEAKRRVNRFDAAVFADKAKAIVESKDFSEEANMQMRAYNLKARVSRLQLMEREMRLETIGLASKEEKMLKEHLYRAYEEEIERQAGIHNLRKGTRQQILKRADRVINGDFHSANFSRRIWSNQQALQSKLERGLTRSLLRGENPKKWARDLRSMIRGEMTDIGKKNAMYSANRLAITETSRVLNEARIQSLSAAGYDAYVWICEPGACHLCKPYDGEVFKVDKALIGATTPPLHPFCKCSIAAHYEYDPDKDEDSFIDITDEFVGSKEEKGLVVQDLEEIQIGDKIYHADGKAVIFDYSKEEKKIAQWLSDTVGGHIYMCPRVLIPEEVRTPDYLWDNEKWDLKNINSHGKNTINTAIKNTRDQSNNVILNLIDDSYTEMDIYNEMKRIFSNKRYSYIDKILAAEKYRIRKIFKRK